MYSRLPLAAAASTFFALAGTSHAFATALDANLFATYTVSPTSVQFDVCGSTADSEGCFGGGTMAPFQHACAVLEGTPHTKGDIVSRDVYVLDRRSSKTAPVTLYVYRRTDTITASYDSVQVTLAQTVPLSILGGPGAQCSMAANNSYIYAGTSVDTSAVAISKTDFSFNSVGGFSPPATIKSITADDRGYVSIEFNGGFYLVNPTGGGEEDGGGGAEEVNTRNGLKF